MVIVRYQIEIKRKETAAWFVHASAPGFADFVVNIVRADDLAKLRTTLWTVARVSYEDNFKT